MDRNSRPVMVACLDRDDKGYCFKTASKRVRIPDEFARTLQPILYESTGHRTVAQLADKTLTESSLLKLFGQLEALGVCYDAHHVAMYGQRAAHYPDPLRLYPGDEAVRQLMQLPPDTNGDFWGVQNPESSEAPIMTRRTQRMFNGKPVRLDELSRIAFAAYGLTGFQENTTRRTVPSAGAMYPLQFDYIVRREDDIPSGAYRWAKHANGFIRYRQAGDAELRPCFIGEEWTRSAVIQVISFDIERSTAKYSSRAHRFALLEAGHAAQNAILAATSLGLGVWEYGGYNDAELMRLIELNGPTCGIATVLFYGHIG